MSETIEEYYASCKWQVRGIEDIYLAKRLGDKRQLYDVIHSYCAKDMKSALSIAVYELDTKCGTSHDEWPPRKEDEQRVIQELDMDYIKYKDIFIRHISLIHGDDRSIFILFSRLIFLFNGYQAPYRTCPRKALEDAMGITDLFKELIEPLIPIDN